MTLNEYQKVAHETSKSTIIGGDVLLYPVMGLAGEVGELLNKVKKIYRDSGGVITDDILLMLRLELGGILWYLAETSTVLGIDLSDVAEANLMQLADRANRGVIGGSGDNR